MAAPDSPPAPHDHAGRDAGLGLTILATGYVIMSLTDGVAKILTADIAPGEIAWARYFFQGMLLAAFGGCTAVGHYLMVIAFRYATAAVLAPTAYVQILSATAFGYIAFGDFPNLTKWIGIAIIVACGIYVFHRETRVRSGG